MRLFSFFICLLLCLSLCACSLTDKTSEEVLTRLLDEAGELPAGKIYRSEAEEGDEGFMPQPLKNAMYGEGCEEYFALVEDFAIYISDFAEPYEIAVFRCYSSTDALKLELMCRGRKDLVSVSLRETSFYELCDDVRVVREGRDVVFLMLDRPDKMVRLTKRLIG